jgi:CheY-like chemotaxis protein
MASVLRKYKKVMVVDDNYLDCYIAEKQLKYTGVTDNIIVHNSASVALDELRASHNNLANLPEVIFLDINMPGINGFDFLDEYDKLDESIKDLVYIIMLTSSVLSEDRVKVAPYPYVRGILHKPLTRDALATAENWL